jgi:glyoxylase-like metal-dependent hydrolase (beta-lactamase superfamily II)
LKVGPWQVDLLSDGVYRLDGGAMFGVVPRVLWEKKHLPDDQNRVELALNCLLLRDGERTVLIDNGMGDGWSEKELAIYGLERPEGDLLANLGRLGLDPSEITDVVLTHLHFDHAGGTVRGEGEEARLVFPNAQHWLQSANLRWAQNPTERDRVSYRAQKWELLLQDPDRLRLVEGATEILPHLRAIPVNGHTPGQQLLLAGEDDDQLLFAGDLVPYASQLRVSWVMAYDLNPLLTLQEKRDILARAASEDWVLVFEHDPEIAAARIQGEDGNFSVRERVEI